MQIDYLSGGDGRVHAINCYVNDTDLEVGALCLVSFPETTARILNENHSFLVEIPEMLRSASDRIKAFNVILNILSHEQV